MDQLLREFLDEADELLEVLAADVEVLRTRRLEGRVRRDTLARVFRQVHTLKGSSASLELIAVTNLAHEFETLLDSIRTGRTSLDDAVLAGFDETVGALSRLLHSVAAGEIPTASQSLVERLRSLAQTAENPDANSGASARAAFVLPDEIARTLSELEQHRLQEALGEGSRMYTVEVSFDMATFDKQFKDFSDDLSVAGEIISTQPGIPLGPSHEVTFSVVYASEQTAGDIAAKLNPFGTFKLAELAVGRTDDSGTAVEDDDRDDMRPSSNLPLAAHIRVDVSELDGIVDATRELFEDTMEAFDLALSSESAADGVTTDLKSRAARIRAGFQEIDGALARIRMVPVQRSLQRAIRAGVVVAREAGKEIDFEIEGGDARFDKSLSDAVSDSVLHLLRNAVDHGIETPGERMSMGKSERGCIKLEAIVAGGIMRLRISDDGRGIDPTRVARAAEARGFIKKGSEVSHEQSLRIIFTPGFSTAESVSTLSGRGVGLDVVERAMEQIGGKVQVHSEVGVGTTFELQLPKTMARKS